MNKVYDINLKYIGIFLGLLHEGVDERLAELENMNLANPDSIRKLVAEYLLPEYQNFTQLDQIRIKESLRFGLNFYTEEQLYSQFPCTDAIFDMPRNMTAKELYKQIWDYMFNQEDIYISDKEQYHEFIE